MGIRIELTLGEYLMGAIVGAMRMIEAYRSGLRDNTLEDPARRELKEWSDVQAACAECSVAKYRNQFWPMTLSARKSNPDLPPDLEVRWTRYETGGLIIRPKDIEDRPYVLVRGEAPKFEIAGWLWGQHAKRDEWLTPEGYWLVPDLMLEPMGTLYNQGN